MISLLFLLLPGKLLALPLVSLDSLPPILKESCALVAVEPLGPILTQFLEEWQPLLAKIQLPAVSVPLSEIIDSGLIHFKLDGEGTKTPESGQLLIMDHQPPNRHCLLKPPPHFLLPGVTYTKPIPDTDSLLSLINDRCFRFWNVDGNIDAPGQHRESILRNVHRLEPDSITLGKVAESCGENGSLVDFFYSGRCQPSFCWAESCQSDVRLPQCEMIDEMPSWDVFFRDYLSQSRPVIIRGAAKTLPFFSKWTPKYFREKYGNERVNVKLMPPKHDRGQGDFEGVEQKALWSSNDTVPEEVVSQLLSPDLVLVRPHDEAMNLSAFLDIIESLGTRNFSAYLEYFSFKELFQREVDFKEWDLVAGRLQLSSTQIWLSDGRTLGKLHFDEFDNFLTQPWKNEDVGEGYLVEAKLRWENGSFHRDRLSQSVSLNFSPLDITHPDFHHQPEARRIKLLNCTLEEGDVLFLPSFWWHEVQSYPSLSQHRNLALNHWYKPFLTKEFPCPKCPMDVNPVYRHFL